MDINNFGPFNSETYGSVGDWFIILGTILSIVLIYLTFKHQKTAFDQQKIKDELDFIINMFTQLDNDVRRFSLTVGFDDKKTMFGAKAMLNYTKSITSQTSITALDYFKKQLEGDEILYLYKSYDLLKMRIEKMTVKEINRRLIDEKTQLYFNFTFEENAKRLAHSFSDLEDEIAQYIVSFYKKNTVKDN